MASMAPPLSSDIIDCVLTSLPDFATLLSTTLVSKSFHEIFQAHPSSILTSVATTQIGPEVLPCAIRLAHFNRDEYLASRFNYVQDFPLERKFSHTEAPAVTSYVATLVKNDSVLRELEIFFSTKCKDRTSGTRSLLNSRESLRFRRAFYRWWLLINLFPACYLLPKKTAGENADDDDDDANGDTDDDTDDGDDDGGGADTDALNVYLTKSEGMRKEFLSEFSDDEVAEMWQIHNFMTFASTCAWKAMTHAPVNDTILLWSGPSTTAEVLRTLRSFDEPKGHLMEEADLDYNHPDNVWPGFIFYLGEKNYDTSKVGTMTWEDPAQDKNMILDNRVEDTEECDECHVPHLCPMMWSSSNWHLLPCAVTLGPMLKSLPGHLGWNSQEILPIQINPWSYADFVNRHISPGTPDWSEGRLLCNKCVLKVMGRYALNSLREIKAQHGPQLEDCWYGYKCRTQRKHDHAVRLNHLCDPTRGD